MADQSPGTRLTLPDLLSIDAHSPHHVAAVFKHDIGIRFNDKERFGVSEYFISEGWVKVPSGAGPQGPAPAEQGCSVRWHNVFP